MLRTITVPELKVGMIAVAYGARFEIITADDVTHLHSRGLEIGEVIFYAKAKWLDGRIEPCYFGPTKDWSFQGNKHARVQIEEKE